MLIGTHVPYIKLSLAVAPELQALSLHVAPAVYVALALALDEARSRAGTGP